MNLLTRHPQHQRGLGKRSLSWKMSGTSSGMALWVGGKGAGKEMMWATPWLWPSQKGQSDPGAAAGYLGWNGNAQQVHRHLRTTPNTIHCLQGWKNIEMEMSCPKRRLENQLIQGERTRRVCGAVLAQHQWQVGPWTYRQIDLITVDKAEELLQIQTIMLV